MIIFVTFTMRMRVQLLVQIAETGLALKPQRLDCTEHFAVTNTNAVLTSYEVANFIAMQKKPNTAWC